MLKIILMSDPKEEYKSYSSAPIDFVQDATADLEKVKISLRWEEYNSFDDKYEKSGFCHQNGGYWLSHPGHHFDGVKGDYERDVARILYLAGYKVILDDEHMGYGIRAVDGKLDNMLFEISTIESAGEYTIQNHLSKSHKKGAEIAVIYFPNNKLFSFEKLTKSHNRYRAPKNSDRMRLWYIVNGEIHHLKY